jgi:hypothetical protein
MRTPQEIESLARQIQFEPDAAADERILRAAEAALKNRSETVRVGATRLRRRYGMQLRIAKWAIAAAILIALGVHFWGGSIDGAGVTLAEVLDQIRDFRPYRCRWSIEEPNKPPEVRTLEQFSLTLRRELYADGSIIVIDLATPKELALYPDKKQAHEHWPDFEPQKDLDVLSVVKTIQEVATKGLGIDTLGPSTIEGHSVLGFQGGPMTLWVDVHTKLPVQIVNVGQGTRHVMDQFEFDVVFDKALFATTAPEGYAVKKTGKGYTDIPHVGEGLPEEPLLTGLKAVAEALDSVFPPAIELPILQETLRQYIADHKFSEEDKEKWLLPVSDYWTRAYWYLNQLQGVDRVKDLHWVGGGVRLGDGTTAIMWWQYQNSPTYRVIYGDLTIRDLLPDQLPK